MLACLPVPPKDALHDVMARYAADGRGDKMDLGVGVYRDATGASPIMVAVKKAEKLRLEDQTSKCYLSLRGDIGFLESMQSMVFGQQMQDRIASIQTIGGTGGIYLAINMAHRANPDLRVVVGTPTWPNHFTICEMLEIETVTYEYFDKSRQTLLFENMRNAALAARTGDVFILHGPCHNPSGEDLSDTQLKDILAILNSNGVIPLVDAAYYGLGCDLDEDLERLAHIARSVPTAMIIMSCSKAFGLYRERVGVLFITVDKLAEVQIVQNTLERIARGTYSMPAAHGASVVGRILSDVKLTAEWKEELICMKNRILGVRDRLVVASKGDPRISAVARQKGIFSLLPLTARQVDTMANDHAIYMPTSGRVNIAGFKDEDISRFYNAILSLNMLS